MHFIMSGFDLTVKFYILFEKVLVESTIVDIDTLINNNAGITNTPKNWNNLFWLFEYLCVTGLVNSSSKVLIFYPSCQNESYLLTHPLNSGYVDVYKSFFSWYQLIGFFLVAHLLNFNPLHPS